MGCGSCLKRRVSTDSQLKKAMILLKKGIRSGLSFNKAMSYAGLIDVSYTQAFNDLLRYSNTRELNELIPLIYWDEI